VNIQLRYTVPDTDLRSKLNDVAAMQRPCHSSIATAVALLLRPHQQRAAVTRTLMLLSGLAR
jgi:hypothetical protein